MFATGARTAATSTVGQLKLDYARPADVPYPEDNAYTTDRELLGRMLFFDPRLSGSSWISCASRTVKSADTVVFESNDNVTHHIYSSTKGQEFNLETVKVGEKTPHAFAKKGRVEVRCGLHPGMRLIVNVE